MVAPVDGDELQPGFTATSAAGLPSYTSSLLPIRFTNVRRMFWEVYRFRVWHDDDNMMMVLFADVKSFNQSIIASSVNGHMFEIISYFCGIANRSFSGTDLRTAGELS